MPDSLLFIRVAQQQGYSEAAAEAALARVRERLGWPQGASRRLYIFRTGDGGVGGAEGASGEPPSRPRLLLAFLSADGALAFAQRAGLGASPRLIGLTISQALAALVQRPAIGALLIAEEDQPPSGPATLPRGVSIERAALIELLTGVTP